MVKNILVSQPAPTSEKSPYHEIAQKHEVSFTFRPFVRVTGIEAREFRSKKINILDYTAIVFTSTAAIDHFFYLCKELRITLPEDMKYFGISEKVILYIQKYVQYRKRKTFFGITGKWEDLITTMVKHKGENYLIPHSADTSLEVSSLLTSKKIKHTGCAMYRTVATEFEPDAYKNYDMIILFTPVGVQSLLSNFPDFKQADLRLGCFGESTAKAMEEAGLRIDLKISGSIGESLSNYLEENKAKK